MRVRSLMVAIIATVVLSATGCSKTAQRTTHSASARVTVKRSSIVSTAPAASSLSALTRRLHECRVIKDSEAASAYDVAFNRGQVSSIFGARESPVSSIYQPGAEAPVVDSCDYNATLAGYGSYSVYTLEWTIDPSAVDNFLHHRSPQPGDTAFNLVSSPTGFTTAYEDNGGLFIAGPGIAFTLGGALGSGVNGVLDKRAADRISLCLSQNRC